MIRFFDGHRGRSPGSGGGRGRVFDSRRRSPPVGVFAAVMVLIALPWAGAQDQGPPGGPRRISPDQAVDMAIRSNLTQESAGIDLAAARRGSALRWNVFLPTVTVGAGLQRSNLDMSSAGMPPLVPPTTVPRWGLGVNLDISLTFNVALFEQMRETRLQYESGLIGYEQAKIQLEREVRKSYYDMLLHREQIGLLRESFETVRRQAAMAQTNYRNGLIPEIQYLQAQVAVENMKPQMEQAESGLRLEMAAFANNLGLPVDTEFELTPLEADTVYIPLDVAELVSRAASGSPDVQALRRQLVSLQSKRRATALQLFTPNLMLSWGARPALMGDPWKDNWFDFDNNWSGPTGSFSISLGFQLNTFLPFTSQGQGLKSLDDGLHKMNIGLAQAVRGTELQIYSIVSVLEQARISAEAQGYTVGLAERSYRLTEQAYRSGASELLELRNAEQQMHQARLSVLQQQFNYRKGLIDLEYNIGVPFGSLSSRRDIP